MATATTAHTTTTPKHAAPGHPHEWRYSNTYHDWRCLHCNVAQVTALGTENRQLKEQIARMTASMRTIATLPSYKGLAKAQQIALGYLPPEEQAQLESAD